MCISRQCKYCCCVNPTWIRNRNNNHHNTAQGGPSNTKLVTKSGLTCSASAQRPSTTSTNNGTFKGQCDISGTSPTTLISHLLSNIKSSVSEVWCQVKASYFNVQQFKQQPSASASAITSSTSIASSSSSSCKYNLLQIHGLLILITFLCYANSIPGDFVHDDIEAIVRNPDVIGSTNWTSIWFNDFWGRPMSDPLSHKSYRPLTVFTFRLNMILRKNENDSSISWKFRAVNVILHILVVQLIMTTVSSILNCSYQMSLMVSLHFAVHPIHTEAVSSNVGRADILCCIFSLITLILFSRACKSIFEDKSNNRMLFYLLLSCSSSTLALLSKETGITILPICILYYVLKLSQQGSLAVTRNRVWFICWNKNLSQSIYCESKSNHSSSPPSSLSSSSTVTPSTFWLYGPIIIPVIMTIALFWFRVSMLHGTLPIFSQQDNPASFSNSLLTRFLTYSYLCAFNWRLLLYPSCLSYDWQLGSIPLVTSLWDVRNLETSLTFILIIGLCTLSIKYILTLVKYHHKYDSDDDDLIFDAKHCPLRPQTPLSSPSTNDDNLHGVIFLGLCFLIIPYLPASNLFVTVGFVVAERVLYIPSIGFSLLFIAGFSLMKQRCLNNHHHQQHQVDHQHHPGHHGHHNHDYPDQSHSNISRWTNVAFYSLLVLFTMKTLSQNLLWKNRETLFLAGLLAVPQNAKMHYNYANLQKDNGNNELAVHHYRQALRLWPTHESSWNNLATLLPDPDEAEHHLIQALKINPYHPKAHFNLACIYSKKGLTNQAINLLQRSIELDSHFAEPYSTLASIYAEKGLNLDADTLHQKSLTLQPNNPDLINNYGAFLQKTGQTEKAIIQYQKALKINPRHKIAMGNLVQIWKSLNDTNLRILDTKIIS